MGFALFGGNGALHPSLLPDRPSVCILEGECKICQDITGEWGVFERLLVSRHEWKASLLLFLLLARLAYALCSYSLALFK